MESGTGTVLRFEEPTQQGKQLILEASVLPVMNFALGHNGAPLVQTVSVQNDADMEWTDLELQITASPAFIHPFTRHIDAIPARQRVEMPTPQVLLDGAWLAAATEKTRGVLCFRLCSQGQVLAERMEPVTVLAFDEWQGMGLHPEMACAFITPNHPLIAAILADAAWYLGSWTEDSALDGYQSQDFNRVLRQAGAIYEALKDRTIRYSVSPASFETVGQRVRLCDMVLKQRMGNCLDLTLLYAACLEAAGLHPLLITQPAHMFLGLWLEDKMFPECVQDDPAVLTKRLAQGIHELAVVETTCLVEGRAASFDQARAQGEKNLAQGSVEYILDVRRARLSGITPIPQRIATESGWVVQQPERTVPGGAAAPKKLEDPRNVPEQPDAQELPRMAQWERKLLDLGMRNTLINLRLTKQQLPLLTDSLENLENAFAQGGDFTVLPRPGDLNVENLEWEALPGLGQAEIIRAEFANKRLRGALSERELTQTLKGLYRSARTAMEENGANTLYLALGLLRWYETNRSNKPRYAPVILLPVELVRRSAAQGYVIRLRDDEPQMNITLLEKLKQDFGIHVSGLDPLPEDEHGLDVGLALTILRKAVMEQPRWDVLEAASLGIFSFSQFVMWNDIRNRADDLLRSKVVRSLMDGKLAWQAEPLEMGDHVSEDGTLLPMAADASQLFAIQAACQGKSFVLHGPPGTGKSQTITSLIANALAQGKRVLFVAEKMAALEVVQKRLDSLGIGPFCLELHSNKSRKRDVLDQLRQATEVARLVAPEDFQERAEALSAARRELDAYALQLHSPRGCGMTLYALIGRYEAFQNASMLEPFPEEFLSNLDAAGIRRMDQAVERLIAAGREVGHPGGHPLSRVGCREYTQSLKANLRQTVEDYARLLTRIREQAIPLVQGLGWSLPENWEAVAKLCAIGEKLTAWYAWPASWAREQDPEGFFNGLEQLAEHRIREQTLSEKITRELGPDALELDSKALNKEYLEAAGKWFLPKFFELRKLLRKINVYTSRPVTKEGLRDALRLLREHEKEKTAAAGLAGRYAGALGFLDLGQHTQWQTVKETAIQARENARQLRKLTGEPEALGRLGADPQLKNAVSGLAGGFARLRECRERFEDALDPRGDHAPDWLGDQLALCARVLENAGALREWTAFRAAAWDARELGLGNVEEHYLDGCPHDSLWADYQKTLLHGLICLAMDESGTLSRFSGAVFNQRLQQYKKMDGEWMELSRQEIYCRLAARVPDFTREGAGSSELGILQRCIKSGGRGVSIRRLFEQIPNLLPRLCPCMLMSPISAAQYLDPKLPPFDIVVFDEASQLPTCKAVGVLARGKDAVIVGDPKQMPPTSFFAVNALDEEHLDTEDLESILDDCLALNMPQTHLLWHYRSRHESLIAFSNRRFYENRLLTFPSVNDRESRVRLVEVEGTFDRGKTRRNLREAEAVVEELRRRQGDSRLSCKSVGVVTFNISQQELIEDLLTDACAKDPALEKWAYGGEEPVFIKNLENVQGDERDVILFSVGYGPDQQGKITMNFGPLNRDGGWRRLNVAVTRARQEMVVFSTLKPEQIDLNRTRAEGVAALRAFLEYAQGRPISLSVDSAGVLRREDTQVAASIRAALAEHGYQADLTVGRSAYRMDVAVTDPADPGKYLLGVLLDGPGYGSAKTTRDREVAQTGVLKGLGWNVLRVWSVDWWNNRDKELKRILDRLEQLQSGRAEEEPGEDSTPVRRMELAPQRQTKPTEMPVYKAAVLSQTGITAEAFTEPACQREIRKRIRAVIKAEAPVSEALLARRIVRSFGFTRAGSRMLAHLQELLGKMPLRTTLQGSMLYYWSENQEPGEYPLYRPSGEGENARDSRDVPMQEAANAICAVLSEQISLDWEDLLREAGKKLGYARVGGQVHTALEDGFQYALARKFLTLGAGNNYILTESGTQRVREGEAALGK